MAKMLKSAAAKAATKATVVTTTKVKQLIPKSRVKAVATKQEMKASKEKVSKYRGVTTGLSVKEFQNKSLKDNAKLHLSDRQLAGVWRKEFPRAVAYTENHVAGVRGAYNRGEHGNDVPQRPIKEYDEHGVEMARPVKADGAKAKVKKEKTAIKPPAVKPTKKLKLAKPSKPVEVDPEEEDEELPPDEAEEDEDEDEE